MQKVLKISKSFLEYLKSYNDGFILYNNQGEGIETGASLEDILGVTLDQLNGRAPLDPKFQAVQLDMTHHLGINALAQEALRLKQPTSKIKIGVFHPITQHYRWITVDCIPFCIEEENSPVFVLSTFNDITEQIENEISLKNKSTINEILLTISNGFISLGEEDLDAFLEKAFQKIGHYMIADRIYYSEYDWENLMAHNRVEWCRQGIIPQINILQDIPIENLKSYTDIHLKGEIICIPDRNALSDSDDVKMILTQREVESVVALPIFSDGNCIGFIGCDYTEKSHRYTQNEIELLQTSSYLIGEFLNKVKKEASLKVSENRLLGLENSQIIYHLRTDLQGNYTFFNVKFEEDFGFLYEKQGGIHRGSGLASICEYHWERTQKTVMKCMMEPGKVFKVELDKPYKNGEIIPTLWEFVCITDDKGNPLEMQCTGFNFSIQKAIRDALSQNESRFQEITALSGSVIWEINSQGYFTFVSDASKRIYGAEPLQLIGKKKILDFCLQPKDLKWLYEKNHGLKEESIELELIGLNGKKRWVTRFYRQIFDEKGNLIRVQGCDRDITKRKKAEEEARTFKAISDQSPSGSVIFSTHDLSIAYCNESFAKIHGYETSELIGKKIDDLIFEQKESFSSNEILDRYKTSGVMETVFQKRKKKDGTAIHLLVSGRIYSRFADVENEFIAESCEDISELIKSKEDIENQKNKIESIISSLPDYLFEMDGEGNYLEVYETGQNREKSYSFLKGQNLSNFCSPEQTEFQLEKVQQSLKSRKTIIFEGPAFGKFYNETEKYFSFRIVPISENKVLRVLTNISDRKAIELENRKLLYAVQQNPTAMKITDLNGNLEYFNLAYETLVERKLEIALDGHINILKYWIEDPSRNEKFRNQIKSNNLFTAEFPVESHVSKMEFWLSIIVSGIKDDKGLLSRFLVSILDITEQKEAARKIYELNQSLEKKVEDRTFELLESNKSLEIAKIEADRANQSKSEFLSRMSHELRTPLNSILGFSQILETTPLQESQRKNLSFIFKSGQELLALVNEVLDISKIEAGKIDLMLIPVDLNSEIKSAVESMVPFANRYSIKLEIPELGMFDNYILTDLDRFRQILNNLLSNAIKYNKNDGSVSVKIEDLEEESFLRIHVIDTGLGIDEKYLPTLFEPFARGNHQNSQIEGTGLGLNVVKHLIDKMNCRIGVKSKVNEGSDFWIDFPKAEKPKSNQSMDESMATPKSFSFSTNDSVLLIEDKESNIQLMEEIFRKSLDGVHLHTTAFKNEAFEILRRNEIKLILLDLNLPEVHGTVILRELKEDPELRHIPVVVITADSDTETKSTIMKLGGNDFITKPFNLNHIIQSINKFMYRS